MFLAHPQVSTIGLEGRLADTALAIQHNVSDSPEWT